MEWTIIAFNVWGQEQIGGIIRTLNSQFRQKRVLTHRLDPKISTKSDFMITAIMIINDNKQGRIWHFLEAGGGGGRDF